MLSSLVCLENNWRKCEANEIRSGELVWEICFKKKYSAYVFNFVEQFRVPVWKLMKFERGSKVCPRIEFAT